MAAKDLFEFFRKTREKSTKNSSIITTISKAPVVPAPSPQPLAPSHSAPQEEIIELDEFPLEDIYYSKTYTFRLDTLVMGGVLGGVLLVICFFLGRLSVGTPEAPVAEAKEKVVQVVAASKTPAEEEKKDESKEKEIEKEIAKGKYEIRVLTSPTEKAAEEVVDFLKQNGFVGANAKQRGSSFQVKINGFEKRDNDALEKIKKLAYKGRTWFDTAYYAKIK